MGRQGQTLSGEHQRFKQMEIKSGKCFEIDCSMIFMQSFLSSLGGGDSDGEEGVEDDDDNLEMTKYDEGEVAVNEEDELAVGSCYHPNHIDGK